MVIEAYFELKELSGLRFVYCGGLERTVGECHGHRAVLELGSAERVVAMDVSGVSRGIDVLNVGYFKILPPFSLISSAPAALRIPFFLFVTVSS